MSRDQKFIFIGAVLTFFLPFGIVMIGSSPNFEKGDCIQLNYDLEFWETNNAPVHVIQEVGKRKYKTIAIWFKETPIDAEIEFEKEHLYVNVSCFDSASEVE